LRGKLWHTTLYRMKRILVTGGAGYIGSVLTRKLLKLGYEVIILDAFVYTDIGIRGLRPHSSLHIINADICDVASLKQSLLDIDCVVHLAAIANDPSAELDVALTRRVNLDIYPVLLNAAIKAGVQRLINMSSIGVYGINLNHNVTEEAPLNPLTEYSRCKAKTETIVEQYNSDKFTTVNLRAGTVCGWSPRMRFDLSTNTLTAYAIVNKKLAVWGGEQWRPQIHIDDLTDFLVELLAIPSEKIGGKVFNAAGYNATVMEIAETIKGVLNGELELTRTPARSDERTYHVSSEKLARELNLTSKRNIRDAVVEILAAYQNGLWKNPDDFLYHNVKRIVSMENTVSC